MSGLEFELNDFGQPVGRVVANWKTPPAPEPITLEGHWCRLEPLDIDRHAKSLFDAYALDAKGALWTYIPMGPFPRYEDFVTAFRSVGLGRDPLFFSIIDRKLERAVGVASYMRITPNAGTIEVGSIIYSPLLQRTPVATDAMYLMMRHAFELGYRRYEWKCNALNAASRRAAQRLGFSYEGIFRQANIIKGRSRDTAWYSIIDREWPVVRNAFETWLDEHNFNQDGKQIQKLSDLTAHILVSKG